MNNTILEKKKRVSDQVLYALIQLSSFLSIFILLVIIGYILYREYRPLIFLFSKYNKYY